MLMLLLAACQSEPQLEAEQIEFSAIAGWQQDNQTDALQAFAISCGGRLNPESALAPRIEEAGWVSACEEALTLSTQQPSATQVRQFFERRFSPYKLSFGSDAQGLLTGYYSPELEGSLQKTAEYSTPVYAPPPEALMPNPPYSRADIVAGVLDGKAEVLAWAKDPVDVFFLQVQGSGYMRLPDNRRILLQYASGNHLPYTSIGKVLKESGEIDADSVTMQSIRAWLAAHPERADEIMNQNASYVFFRRVDEPTMPRGAQGVPLTPLRSLAVDASYVPYGLPVFLDTQVSGADDVVMPMRRLMIAQDTGGAIRGALRGDIFFGIGDDAAHYAGRQQFPGNWVVLLPYVQGAGNATQLARQ